MGRVESWVHSGAREGDGGVESGEYGGLQVGRCRRRWMGKCGGEKKKRGYEKK